MNDVIIAQIQARLRRVERQNRVLVALLCAVVGIASIAAANAGPNLVSADEVRSRRFTLLAPNGSVAAEWYSDSNGGLHGP
jgi:hypothetical protein